MASATPLLISGQPVSMQIQSAVAASFCRRTPNKSSGALPRVEIFSQAVPDEIEGEYR
jgi:hypothetical protein